MSAHPLDSSSPLPLPENPSLEWLRKQAKRRLRELRASRADVQLADAQFELAKQYGFPSWRALKAHIESLTLDGQLFEAARAGDVVRLTTLLDQHPDKLYVRNQPYEWTLLHVAAHQGHLAAVELLLARGLHPNTREKGDDTYAMHWAAAAGHLDVVQRLADAGGDVVGHGDDHQLEVIGWASCWDGTDDDAHRAIVRFLLSRGARHHIFSAIAMNLADEVQRIVADDPATLNQTLSRFEDYRQPLHFAVQRDRPEMVALLIDLGADPFATDGTGYSPAAYATTPDTDRSLLEIQARGGARDLFTALALGDWDAASQRLREDPSVVQRGGASFGVLHLMAKRNNIAAVQWLLDHDVDPNQLWPHWDAEVTPLHMAALQGHMDVVRALLDAGADPRIRDSKHDSDAIGWAEFFERPEMVQLLTERAARQ